MEGLAHHHKRTWAKATAEAASAGLHPSGTLYGQRDPLPTGTGILWVGHVIGDNSMWQMASMQNLTTEEAIARITISTQIDPPGTKIVLRREQRTTAQTAIPAEAKQSTPRPGQEPPRTLPDAATTSTGGTEVTLTARSDTSKDAWNRQQLSRSTGNDAVSPMTPATA